MADNHISVQFSGTDAGDVRFQMLKFLGAPVAGKETTIVKATVAPLVFDNDPTEAPEPTEPEASAPAAAPAEPRKPRGRPAKAAAPALAGVPASALASALTPASEPEKPAPDIFDDGEDDPNEEVPEDEEDDDLIGGFAITVEGLKGAMNGLTQAYDMEHARKFTRTDVFGGRKFSEFVADAKEADLKGALKAITAEIAKKAA